MVEIKRRLKTKIRGCPQADVKKTKEEKIRWSLQAISWLMTKMINFIAESQCIYKTALNYLNIRLFVVLNLMATTHEGYGARY